MESFDLQQQSILGCSKDLIMIPKRLFRFFKERDHAEQFVNGKIRIGIIDSYKRIEDDSRRDELEGTSSIIWDKPAPLFNISTHKIVGKSSTEKIKSDGKLMNQFYLLCTSSLMAKNKMIELGYIFMVEINDPSWLLEILKQCWHKYQCSFDGKVELKRVKYIRGNIIKPNKYLIEPFDYYYIQKSPKDKLQYEYRFVFLCHFDNRMVLNDYEIIDIGNDNNVIKKGIIVMTPFQAPTIAEN